MAEKRVSQLPPLRVCESLEIALMRLAAQDHRSLSDYMRAVLERHCYGHAINVDFEDSGVNSTRA